MITITIINYIQESKHMNERTSGCSNRTTYCWRIPETAPEGPTMLYWLPLKSEYTRLPHAAVIMPMSIYLLVSS